MSLIFLKLVLLCLLFSTNYGVERLEVPVSIVIDGARVECADCFFSVRASCSISWCVIKFTKKRKKRKCKKRRTEKDRGRIGKQILGK